MKPILFSTPMVQAILEGRKTMTRRVVKDAIGWNSNWQVKQIKEEHIDGIPRYEMRRDLQCSVTYFKCPYGQPGDVLAVKETHFRYGNWFAKEGEFTSTGKQAYVFVPLTEEVRYFDNPPEKYKHGMAKNEMTACWYKRPSLFLELKNCRIFLQITDIRVERLQEISCHDAGGEGVEYDNIDWGAFEGGELVADYKNYTWEDDESYPEYYFPVFANPIDSFRTLWQSINGPESWEANPWVWVVEFKRIDKPVNFL